MTAPGEPARHLTLDEGLTRSGMSYEQLWVRQLGLGGDISELELEAYLLGLLQADPYIHDLIAQALNDFFIEQGMDHPVAYSDLEDPAADSG